MWHLAIFVALSVRSICSAHDGHAHFPDRLTSKFLDDKYLKSDKRALAEKEYASNTFENPVTERQGDQMTFPPFVLITRAPAPSPTSTPVSPQPSQGTILLPTQSPVRSPTNRPIPLPTDAPVAIPTNAPDVTEPTAGIIPTMAPVKAVTDQPTGSPTNMPIKQVVSPTSRPTISASPTMPPTSNMTSVPTLKPSLRPTVVQTESPTIFNGTESPVSQSPTQEGTPVDIIIEGITITFLKVERQSGAEFRDWEKLTEEWFNDFYNDESLSTTRSQRTYNNIRNRSLQLQTQVRNMESSITIQTQNVLENSNTITFNQQMKYVLMQEGDEPETILLAPYRNVVANGRYGRKLRSEMTSFANVGLPIQMPRLLAAPAPELPPTPVPSTKSEKKLETNAIIGIAVGGAVLLLVVAFGGYSMLRKSNPEMSTPSKVRPLEVGNPTPSVYMSAQSGIKNTSDIRDPVEMSGLADMSTPAIAAIKNEQISSSKKLPLDAASYDGKSIETGDFDYDQIGINSAPVSLEGTGDDNESKSTSIAQYSDSDIQLDEDQFVVYAPAGKLGLVVDNPDDGAPVVHAIKEDSVLSDQVQVGDRLVGVDEVDVRSLSPVKVSKLISKRSTNPLRKLTLIRTKHPIDDAVGDVVGSTAEPHAEESSHVGSMSRMSGISDPMDPQESLDYPDDGSSQVDAMSNVAGEDDDSKSIPVATPTIMEDDSEDEVLM